MGYPRLLLTGGCGFLGHHLIQHFINTTKMDIVVLDKLTYASAGFDRLREIGAYDNPRVKIIGCDLIQPIPDGVKQEIGDTDYIIHAAAETHVDHSIRDPLPFLQSNIIGTHNLLWFARELDGLKRIFIQSTDEVFGPAQFGDDIKGFDEEATYRPANPYAASKAGTEMLGFAYGNTYGLPITIIDAMNLVGERQHFEKLVPKCIRASITQEEIQIHADSTLKSGTRFYLHCRTLANAYSFLIDWVNDPTFGVLYEKINISGDREISNLEMVDLIEKIVERPIKRKLVSVDKSRPGHDLRYALCDDLIQKMGWKRPMTLEKSLEKTVKWYLKNPKWLGL